MKNIFKLFMILIILTTVLCSCFPLNPYRSGGQGYGYGGQGYGYGGQGYGYRGQGYGYRGQGARHHRHHHEYRGQGEWNYNSLHE
jgi:hypothetical protein